MRSVLIALLTVLVVTSGCANDEPAEPSGSENSSKSTDRASEAPAEPEPIMLGTQRYASPCRLFDTEDVAAVYGATGPYAHFEQQLVEGSKSVAEMAEIDKTVAGAVNTSCSYTLDNRAESVVKLEVKQYSSPQQAQRAWQRIRRLGTGIESRQLRGKEGWEWLLELARENERNQGGVPIPGLDRTVLYVSGSGAFTGVRGNLLLVLSRKDYNVRNPFEPRQVKGTLRTAGDAFQRIYAHADEGAPDQTPLPGYWQQQEGWPEFVDACAALDDKAMMATIGQGTTQVRSYSVARDPDTRLKRNSEPSYRAVYNECDRTGQRRRDPDAAFSRSDFWHATLQLWYVAPGDTGNELLEGWLLRKLFGTKKKPQYDVAGLVKEKVLTPTEIPGADLAYVFDYGKGRDRYSFVVVNKGGYVFFLDGDGPNPRTRTTYDSLDATPAQLVAGAAQVLANIDTITEESADAE